MEVSLPRTATPFKGTLPLKGLRFISGARSRAEGRDAGRPPATTAEDGGAGLPPAEGRNAGRAPAKDDGAGRAPAKDDGAGRPPATTAEGGSAGQSSLKLLGKYSRLDIRCAQGIGSSFVVGG